MHGQRRANSLSTIVLGELMYGFYRGSRLKDNALELDLFLRSPFVTLVPVTRTTSDRFGRIASQLSRRGKPIPSNDIWIAAQAQETGAALVTFDAHFNEVEGLVVVCPG